MTVGPDVQLLLSSLLWLDSTFLQRTSEPIPKKANHDYIIPFLSINKVGTGLSLSYTWMELWATTCRCWSILTPSRWPHSAVRVTSAPKMALGPPSPCTAITSTSKWRLETCGASTPPSCPLHRRLGLPNLIWLRFIPKRTHIFFNVWFTMLCPSWIQCLTPSLTHILSMFDSHYLANFFYFVWLTYCVWNHIWLRLFYASFALFWLTLCPGLTLCPRLTQSLTHKFDSRVWLSFFSMFDSHYRKFGVWLRVSTVKHLIHIVFG